MKGVGDLQGSVPCSAQILDNLDVEDLVDEEWDKFERAYANPLNALCGDSVRKLEAYFRSRFVVRWTT